MMNIESRGSNNQGRSTQATSSHSGSNFGRQLVTFTSTERTSRTTQPLQTPPSYDFI